MKPIAVTVRMYDVGFGDCFLLTVHYRRAQARHVLIDFGTTAHPREREFELLMPIAEDIATRTAGKLHAIVATHRHRDHIGGFVPFPARKAPGAVIARLEPELVVQPWTEDPAVPEDALSPAATRRTAQALLQLVDQQAEMHPLVRQEIMALAQRNLPNRQAIAQLAKLGETRRYVRAGQRSGLEVVLPGVKVAVLGPVASRRRRRAGKLPALLAIPEPGLRGTNALWRPDQPLFPGHAEWRGVATLPTRWLRNRIHDLHAEQILSLTRAFDADINNTSVVLLIEAAGQRLLFPGDAEEESWTAMLGRKGVPEKLGGVHLYKVGHHGSANGTPDALWRRLPRHGGMISMLSTQLGVHGQVERGTEVPRQSLVELLAQESQLFDTRTLRRCRELSVAVELAPGAPPRTLEQ